MALATINREAYGRLLAQSLPGVIQTESENDRMITQLEKLDRLSRALTPEEERLAELMTLLIQEYEQRYELGHATPLEALKVLMESRELRQRDLIPVFGASSVVSDVLKGKREISKTHARKLADFFHVTPSLFI